MKINKNDLIIPENTEIVFEDYCLGCDKAEPIVVDREVTENGESETIHRITCNNVQICLKAREIAATEKSKEYPFV